MVITSLPILEKISPLELLKIIINMGGKIVRFHRDEGIFILIKISKSDDKIFPDLEKKSKIILHNLVMWITRYACISGSYKLYCI
jgi:hypothetical protein